MGVAMYLRWLCFLPASLAFDVFGRLLTPLVVLFADKDGWLPSWLWWWQTPDNPIDGDAGHLARWGISTAPLTTYVRRVAWLWRNCGYGFNIDVLGFHHQAGDVKEVYGDPAVGDTSGVSGVCRWKVYRAGKPVCWQFYYVKHYRIFGVWKCVRIGAGWKIWGQPVPGYVYGQHWVYFHPMKGSGRNK
nr:MAG TPA: Envelope protein [Caudoviricetes sp.]